ncbi:MAG: methyltransferase domain-containing protein [Deltaproteobacteria bacterium]|jgi:ubiquinone/menaquinone biosynthesis C-methylase UbiE|nr:methyltransferase domain-containing protein [Deltaproteobacteria bacterium]
MKKRSHRLDKMARVYDDEILPIWSQRFGRMLIRGLEVPSKAMVLDVGCGTGYPALELLKRMDEQSRIIAIDPVGALLDVARKKAGDLAGKRIFFRSEAPTSKLAFADEVYDLVISNLGVLLLDSPKLALKEFGRVSKVGGRVVITLPLAGTYGEFYDIYREVLTKGDQHEVLDRLEVHIAKNPEPDVVVSWLEEAGLVDVDVDVEEFSLLFKSSREFFFAPVIEFGPLSAWKEIAGKGQTMQEIFWHIKEAIDAYFGDRAFEITVKAGCFRGTRPGQPEPEEPEEAVTPPRTDPTPRHAAAPEEPEDGPIADNFRLDDDDEDQ